MSGYPKAAAGIPALAVLGIIVPWSAPGDVSRGAKKPLHDPRAATSSSTAATGSEEVRTPPEPRASARADIPTRPEPRAEYNSDLPEARADPRIANDSDRFLTDTFKSTAPKAVPFRNVKMVGTAGVVGDCIYDYECDDCNPCTWDVCDSGTCVNTPQRLCSLCDDNRFCNGREKCDGMGNCVPAAEVDVEPVDPDPCFLFPDLICDEEAGTPSQTAGDCVVPCRADAECDDGLLCTGGEVCVFGGIQYEGNGGECVGGANAGQPCTSDAACAVCQGGANDGMPCDPDADCPDGKCSAISGTCVGGVNDGQACDLNSTCPGGGSCGICGGVCRPDPADPPPCGEGTVCEEAAPPLCGNGRCCSVDPDIPGEFVCCRTTQEDCLTNGCPGGVPPHRFAGIGDSPDTPMDDVDCLDWSMWPPGWPPGAYRCPYYSSGIAPRGSFMIDVSPIGYASCAGPYEVGDDYRLSTADSAYPFLDLSAIRFYGGFEEDAQSRVLITFYDAEGRFVDDVIWEVSTDHRNGLGMAVPIGWQFMKSMEDVIIPAEGWITLQPHVPGSSLGSPYWFSTDDVDVGSNDPDRMWVNGKPVTDYLPGVPDILAFEIVGFKTSAPTGACCNPQAGGCTLELPWICAEQGGLFHGIGTFCQACSNNLSRSCVSDADCHVCQGGDNWGLPCASDNDCPNGSCDTSPTCAPIPPDCQVTACCEPETGACTEVTGGFCDGDPLRPCYSDDNCSVGEQCLAPCPAGTVAGGFGTTCEPNCCESAPLLGADNCEDAPILVVNVPLLGEPPVTFTISGDNSPASLPDTCDLLSAGSDPDYADRGWWVGFDIDSCAHIRVDLCCTDPPHIPTWDYLVLGTRGLEPPYAVSCCEGVLSASAVPPPIGPEEGSYPSGNGPPFCNDDNHWVTFGPVPGGLYFYPIYSGPTGHIGPYQLHMTVGACPEAACCLPDGTCAVLNEINCDDLGGYWLGPGDFAIWDTIWSCDPDPCSLGSCCLGPGDCTDSSNPACDPNVGWPDDPNCCDHQGAPQNCMTEADCVTAGGTYIGGAQCNYPKDPCPACQIAGEDNCQLYNDNDFLVLLSDLTVKPHGAVHADDFVPHDTVINQVCVWGAYLEAGSLYPDYDCAGTVEDNFRVRIYEDDNGLPGTLIAERTDITGPAVIKSEVPGSGWEIVYELPMWVFTLSFPTITLPSVGETYWLEVANKTDVLAGGIEDPENTCYWHWAQVVMGSTEGNRYNAVGTDDRPGEPPGSGYTELSGRWSGTAFCLGGPDGPVNFDPPDPPTGACCDCAGVCENGVTHADCADLTPGSVRHWTAGATCNDLGVCDLPEGDECDGWPPPGPCGEPPEAGFAGGIPVTDGLYGFDTACATTDGPPNPIPSYYLGKDLWYCYTTTCTGELVASMCASSVYFGGYDAYMAVYHDFNNPTECPCPTTEETHVALGDENCNGIADGGAGYFDGQLVFPGEKWLIRVGGWGASPDGTDSGRGFLDVACLPAVCYPSSPPQAEMIGTEVSRKNRFLSILAGDPGRTQAIRVTAASLPGTFGFDTWNGQQWYAGEPEQFCENSGNGTDVHPPDCGPAPGLPQKWFHAAPLVCGAENAHFMDWTTLSEYCVGGSNDGLPCPNGAGDCPGGSCGSDGVIHLYHEGIIPSQLDTTTGPIDKPAEYDVAVVDSTCTLEVESSYSDPLTIRQAAWADVVWRTVDCPNRPPDDAVDVADLVAVLNKFQNLDCAPKKARTDLLDPTGCTGGVDFVVNVSEMTQVMTAFATTEGYPCRPGHCTAKELCSGGPDDGNPCTDDSDCSSDPCTQSLSRKFVDR